MRSNREIMGMRDDVLRDHYEKVLADIYGMTRKAEFAHSEPAIAEALIETARCLVADGKTRSLLRAGLILEVVRPFLADSPCLYAIYGAKLCEAAAEAKAHVLVCDRYHDEVN